MGISIRATNLERFITCPFAYKYSSEPEADKKCFTFGTALHMLVEMHVQHLENEDAINMILYPFEDKERRMLKALTECFIEHLKERNLTYVLSEYSFTYRFEDIIGAPLLEGTFDLLFKDEEDRFVFVDIKTAAKHRDDEHIEAVNQKRIYPALAKLCSGIDVYSFEYRVMNKILHPKLQEVVFVVPEDNVETVTNYMQTLQDAEDNLDYPTKYPNHTCFFCQFNRNCYFNNLKNNDNTEDTGV